MLLARGLRWSQCFSERNMFSKRSGKKELVDDLALDGGTLLKTPGRLAKYGLKPPTYYPMHSKQCGLILFA